MKQPPALSNSTGQDENNNENILDSEKRSDRLPEQVSDSESEIQIESKDASTPAPGSEECEAESVSSPPVSVASKESETESVNQAPGFQRLIIDLTVFVFVQIKVYYYWIPITV